MLLDSGATKTCAGKRWLKMFLELLDSELRALMEEREEKRNFKFGSDAVFQSRKEVIIPIKIGNLIEKINVSIVDTNIPLLLSRADMHKLGFTIDFENDLVTTSKTGETFKAEKSSKGHLALSFIPFAMDDSVLTMEDDDADTKKLKIEKVHKIMGHPKYENLLSLYKHSSDNDKETMDLVKEVSEEYQACLKFRRTP